MCLAIGVTTALGTDGDVLLRPHRANHWSFPVVGRCPRPITGRPITGWDEAQPGRDSSETAHIEISLPNGVGCWGTGGCLVLRLCARCGGAPRAGLVSLHHGRQQAGRRTGRQLCGWKAIQQHLPLAYRNPRDSYDPIS